MVWTYRAEVTPVECGDLGHLEAFSDCDQTGICASETQISVRLDQIGDPSSVGGRGDLDLQVPAVTARKNLASADAPSRRLIRYAFP